MIDLKTVLVMGGITLISHSLGTMIGFGNNVLAYPLLLIVKDIYFVRPMLGVFGFITFLSIVITHFRHTDIKVFFEVLIFGSIGIAIGIYLYNFLERRFLLLFVGLFIIFSAIRGILETFFKKTLRVLPKWSMNIILVLSGIFQGALSTGGSVLAIYMSQKFKDKEVFRATLASCAMFYIVITLLQLFIFVPAHIYKPGITDFKFYVLVSPFLFLAIFIGQKLATRVPVELFRKLIYSMLLVGGISMFISSLRDIFF